MKDALPAHLTRARWLAKTLPAARIVCATTPAALDVLLYRPPATIETAADPQNRILAHFDALLIVVLPIASEIPAITNAVRGCVGQVAIAITAEASAKTKTRHRHPWPDLYSVRAASTELFTSFPL